MRGIITEIWVSCTIVVSNSFAAAFCSSNNLLIAVVQAVNLFNGREIVRHQKSQCQPSIILVTLRRPSAFSLWRAAISCNGIGSSLCRG